MLTCELMSALCWCCCLSVLCCESVSEAESSVKVAEWQQTYYASDSGIQSGATTVRDDEESECSKKYTVSGTTVVESTSGRSLALGMPLSPLFLLFLSLSLSLRSVYLSIFLKAHSLHYYYRHY